MYSKHVCAVVKPGGSLWSVETEGRSIPESAIQLKRPARGTVLQSTVLSCVASTIEVASLLFEAQSM